jgi:hypothetical protein
LLPKSRNNLKVKGLVDKKILESSIVAGVNVFLTQIYVSNLTSSQTIKWLSHLIILSIIPINYLYYKLRKLDNINLSLFNKANIIVFLFLCSLSIREIAEPDEIKIIKYSVFICAIFILIKNFKIMKISGLDTFQILIITFITTYGFLLLPNGQAIMNITSLSLQKILFIIFIISLGIILYAIGKKIRDQDFKYLSFGLIFINILFSFRNDQYDTRDGSFFHISYFSDVVRTLKSGGTLLWDTPSQYGFLSVLIPSWFPIANTREAFFLWQSLAILLFLIAVYIFLQKTIHGKKQLFFVYSTFSLLFSFADPALIGPQPFPSSSTMRFGPSVLLLLFLIYSIRTENLTKHSQKIIYIALLVTCFLWSSESLIYGLAISGLYSFFRMMNSGSKFIVLAPALSIISSIFLINVYTLIKTKNLADLDMFFMYSKSYSEGYGSLPLSLFSPLLVIYMIIFCTIFFAISSKENSNYLELIYLSSFALLIWITYYLGRAVSNNIMVLLPIFFLISYLMYNSIKLTNIRYKSAMIHAFTVFISLFILSFLMQPKLTKTVFQLSFGFNSLNPVTNVIFDYDLKERTRYIESENIVYSSWAAGVPLEVMDRDFSFSHTPLPVPLQLLEEPINQEVAKVIILRYLNSSNLNEIYFIQSKDNEYERRLQYWTSILNNYYDCTQTEMTTAHTILSCSIDKGKY